MSSSGGQAALIDSLPSLASTERPETGPANRGRRWRLSEGLRVDRALQLVWTAAPRWAAASAILLLLQGLLPLLWLYVFKLIVDRLTGAAVHLGPAQTFEGVLVLLGAAFGVSVATALCNALSGFATTALSHRVTDYVQDLVQRKSLSLDIAYYESSHAYDKLHRAQREAPTRPTRAVRELAALAQSVLTLSATLGMLALFHWTVVLVVLVASVPLLLYRLKYAQLLFEWRRDTTRSERLAMYLNDILTKLETAKEVRLFGFGEVMRERFARIRDQLREGLLRISGQRHRKEFLFSVVAGCAGYATLAVIAFDAVHGSATVGDLAMYFGAFQFALTALRGTLSGLGDVYENNLFLSALHEFLQVPAELRAPRPPRPVPSSLREGLRVEGLSFRYPGTEQLVLEDVSLFVPAGHTVALVGRNGSGKTTLIKLLCRLYDPSTGAIFLDGVDIREFDPPALRARMGVMFQDFVHYQLSARENISLGRPERAPDDRKIRAAAERAAIDAKLRALPDGYDTVLSRSLEDGAELSIGQWQKLALARAFYRDAPLIIFDEPTSAMDADGEDEFLNTFRDMVRGHTAILTSHRFSTVRMASYIYVLDRGRILESGCHEHLVARQGLYAELYRKQSLGYRDG